jgi:hypothetical protein
MSDTGMGAGVKVRILTETHEHAGKIVPKGTVLDVSPKTATHFVKIGAGEFVAAPAGAAAAQAGSATKATGGAE